MTNYTFPDVNPLKPRTEPDLIALLSMLEEQPRNIDQETIDTVLPVYRGLFAPTAHETMLNLMVKMAAICVTDVGPEPGELEWELKYRAIIVPLILGAIAHVREMNGPDQDQSIPYDEEYLVQLGLTVLVDSMGGVPDTPEGAA